MPAPATSLHYHPLVRAVARGLRQRCGVEAGQEVVVACSGGADSVALLRAMHLLAPRRRWRLGLTVAHVQHHLRPDGEAEGDATFVEGLANQLDLPFKRADVTCDVTSRHRNVEAAARRQRYRALWGIADASGAGCVATGHHGDDQLETLLMRLLRGASVHGLSGMAWRRPLRRSSGIALIRPMLRVDHDAAVDLLHAMGQPWREDGTNTDVLRTRARLRRDVLPTLRDLRGDVAGRATAMCDHLRDVAELVESATDDAASLLVANAHGVTLPRDEARRLSLVVLSRLIHRTLLEAGVPGSQVSQRLIRAIVDMARDERGGRREVSCGRGVVVVVTRDVVRVTKEGTEAREGKGTEAWGCEGTKARRHLGTKG